jgi:hypothetical protein
MNSLDRKLELFAANEPDPAAVQEAQRKLEARIASAPVKSRKRVTGWLAAAASAIAAVAAFVWLPLTPMTAMAFSQVQEHFRDFNTLRFEFEQRMNGDLLVKGRVSVLANGSVRTEVGDDVTVIVNMAEKRVLTLIESGHIAMQTPLTETGTKEDAMAWLQEVRDFQGVAQPLSRTRWIGGERAQGWELPMAQGRIVLWANAAGLPLEMELDQDMKLAISFRFEFEPKLAAELFSTAVPAGYTLQPSEDD